VSGRIPSDTGRRIEVLFTDDERKYEVDVAEGTSDESTVELAEALVHALDPLSPDEAEKRLHTDLGEHATVRRSQ